MSSSNSSQDRGQDKEVRERLWDTRQELYRLYDLENMSEWQIKDLLVLYELFEEYRLEDLLSEKEEGVLANNNKLNEINADMNRKISIANKNRDIKGKSLLTKKLDKVLTLIALVEEGRREAISRLLATYRLMKRNNNMLLRALQDYYYDNGKDGSIEEAIATLKEELEREIIELKKRL